MANCVLCGKKVGILDQVKEDFHGTTQIFCYDCSLRFYKADAQEPGPLEQQILASPHLLDGETVRANLDTGKPCPACGATLRRVLQNFSIGRDGYGGLTSMGLPSYEVDLYACPSCGKVELYTAKFKPDAQKEKADEKVVCPVCGTRHSARIGCPRCALNAAQGGASPGAAREKQGQRPPWEK